MAKDKFEEHLEQTKERYVPNMSGAFDCQICDEFVREAYHDRQTRMIVWKCSQGHASYISEVSFG